MIKTTFALGRAALCFGLISLILTGAVAPTRAHAETPDAVAAPAATATAPLTDDEKDALNKGEIPTGQYVVGGLVATFLFPLGVGQAIQGRYGDTGWIFTVGEIGSIVAIVAGAAASTCRTAYASSTSLIATTSCDTSPVLWAGVGGLIVFRIWEIVDSWVGPAFHNQNYQRAVRKKEGKWVSYYVAPTSQDSMAMGLQLRF